MSTTTYAAHQNGYLSRRKASPAAIGGAIAIHAGAVAALLLIPNVQVDPPINWVPLRTIPITPDKKPPEPTPRPRKEQKPTLQRPVIPTPDPIVPLPNPSDYFPTTRNPEPVPPLDPGPRIIEPPISVPPAPRPPLFIDSKIDNRFARNFQPEYPPARLREEEEGRVTVRVRIGTDGRVLSVDQIFASHPDFWKAAREQALKAWRFVPATRDGVAVESTREMTVYFRMQQ